MVPRQIGRIEVNGALELTVTNQPLGRPAEISLVYLRDKSIQDIRAAQCGEVQMPH
jgi:hypothetical protein